MQNQHSTIATALPNSSIFTRQAHSLLGRLASRRSFFLALDIYLVVTFIRTTMFEEVLPVKLLNIAAFVALLLFGIRLLRNMHLITPAEWMLQLASMALLLPPVFTSSVRTPLYLALLAFSARGIKLDKILKRYVIISAVCCLVTVVAAQLGLIVNVMVDRGDGVYFSWGFYYLTEFSAHLISLCLAAIYLLRDHLRAWHSIVVLTLGLVTYELTNSKLSLVMFVLAALAVIILSLESTDKLFKAAPVSFVFVGLALLALICTVAYSPDNPLMTALDNVFTKRLSFSSKGLWDYGITAFGQHVTMQGWGGSQKVWGDHIFYLDCSYINILLRCGSIPLLVALWLMTRSVQRAQYRSDNALVACLALIAVNSLINEHLLDITYNPFICALCATLPGGAQHLKESAWLDGLPEIQLCKKALRKAQRATNQRHAGDYAQDSRVTKHPHNPVLAGRGTECFFDPFVTKVDHKLRMFVSRRSDGSIVAYESTDGITWTQQGVCLKGRPKSWDTAVNRCCVVHQGNTWLMWYTGQSNDNSAIGLAESTDGIRFHRKSDEPVLSSELDREGISAMNPSVLENADGTFQMFYAAGEDFEPDAIWRAVSSDGMHWTKPSTEPALAADPAIGFQSFKVGGPEVHRTVDGGLALLYIGYQNLDVARVCMALSSDGKEWRRADQPLITPGPEEWDSCAVYKPTAMQTPEGTAIWYNGRNAHKESIGLATCNVNLFLTSDRATGKHMAPIASGI
ncbi:MAG: hypothetical protein ACI4B6_05625 [Atopobiaceae bacterium]